MAWAGTIKRMDLSVVIPVKNEAGNIAPLVAEITAALALSQQLMKHDKVTRQQALDRILAARKSGQGWGAIARNLGLKLGDVVTDVKKTDKQLAKLATVKVAG